MCFLTASQALAHGDLHLQIAELTQALKLAPHEAVLWHKRGELYRAHHDYDRALSDYARAERLDPELRVVALSRGRALYEAGRLLPAERSLSRFLEGAPQQVEALLLRARVRARLSRREAAELDFVAALGASIDPLPDLYLERAQNLASIGKTSEALDVLEQGKRRLGPLVTLDDAALELELSLKRYSAALARVDEMLSRVARQEHLLARKASILDLAGEGELARQVRVSALGQIEALPEAKQKLASTRELSRSLQQELARAEPR
jgi:tetratricopeptide (TPR) repeat protein